MIVPSKVCLIERAATMFLMHKIVTQTKAIIYRKNKEASKMLRTLLTPLYATSNSSPLVTKSNTKEHINMTKSTTLIDEAIKISNLPKKFRIKNIFKIKII